MSLMQGRAERPELPERAEAPERAEQAPAPASAPTPPAPPPFALPGEATAGGSAEGGPRVLEVPDGRGGTTRIVIGEDGSVIVGTPGESTMSPPANDIPQGVVRIMESGTIAVVTIVLGISLARLIGRWMDRRSLPTAPSPDVARRLEAIEAAVDSIAIEVERISEGQRFTSKLLSERAQAPAPDFAAARVPDALERLPR